MCQPLRLKVNDSSQTPVTFAFSNRIVLGRKPCRSTYSANANIAALDI
uniref:Uncharacterized protein n=1 Tax=Caenorhabditis japonica TaxID=281687 RepID=A0A8R1IRA2_CAEJA